MARLLAGPLIAAKFTAKEQAARDRVMLRQYGQCPAWLVLKSANESQMNSRSQKTLLRSWVRVEMLASPPVVL